MTASGIIVCPSCVHRVSIGRLRTCFGSTLAFYQIRDKNRAKLKISYSCGYRVSKSARYDATLSKRMHYILGYGHSYTVKTLLIFEFYNVSEANIYKIIVDLFLAGGETTGTSLDWAILYMIKYPHIQQKCQNEIEKVQIFSHFCLCFKLPCIHCTTNQRTNGPVNAHLSLLHIPINMFEYYDI